tara:strand:+ start:1917 stop:2234 length:318 start_codon:yes stop_codon:yes gene_type:complete
VSDDSLSGESWGELNAANLNGYIENRNEAHNSMQARLETELAAQEKTRGFLNWFKSNPEEEPTNPFRDLQKLKKKELKKRKKTEKAARKAARKAVRRRTHKTVAA